MINRPQKSLKDDIIDLCDSWIESGNFNSLSKIMYRKLREIAKLSGENQDIFVESIHRFCKTYTTDSLFTPNDSNRLIARVLLIIFTDLKNNNKLNLLSPDAKKNIDEFTAIVNIDNNPTYTIQKLYTIIGQYIDNVTKEKHARKEAMQKSGLMCFYFLLGRRKDSLSPINCLPLDVIKIILSYSHPFSTNAAECDNFSHNAITFFNTTRIKIEQRRIAEFKANQDVDSNRCSIS